MMIEMSRWTRLAQTDAQEEAIEKIEKKLERKGLRIVGGTTIGKEPQTVLLDLTYQGGEIRIDNDGKIEINYNDIDEAELNENYDDLFNDK